MIVHKTEKGYIFKRESWTEWFRLPVSAIAAKEILKREIQLPKGLVVGKVDRIRDVVYFYLWPLIPFIKIADFALSCWYFIPKKLYRAGHLKHIEGNTYQWFWLKDISIRKIDREN